MTTLQSSARISFVDFVAVHNPFYLLSAACMLGGCLALTNTLTWSPISLERLVPLIVTLNIYELALIGLALYLVRRRGLARDGRTLLVLQAVFLVDLTFLNAEIVTLDLTAGLIANGILLPLAVLKVAVVLRILDVRLSPVRQAYILVQLIVLFALPVAFKMMDRDAVSPLRFYAAWWVVGMLPAVYELLTKLLGDRPQSVAPAAQAAPTAAYLALPWVSMLLHLAILHFVYDTRLYGAHLAPVLLGLALVMNRLQPTPLARARDLLILRVLMPFAAIIVSLNNPSTLAFDLGTWLHVTPLPLVIGIAYVVYVYCFLPGWAMPMLAAGAVLALLHLYGPSVAQVMALAQRGAVLSWQAMMQLMPRTAAAWGIVAVVASFVFLAIGAGLSLRKRPQTLIPPDPPV